MSIPTEFQGTIYAYWQPAGYLHFSVFAPAFVDNCLPLGKIEVEMQFGDKRKEAAEQIDAQIEKERAESADRIAILQDRKQQLLAIEGDV